MRLGNSSSVHTIRFGLEKTNHCIDRKVFLFPEDFPIISYQFNISSQEGFKIVHGLLSNKNFRIPIKKNKGPPYPAHFAVLGRKRGVFSKLS